ncbi:hypothetical protein [Okeania sp. SIO2B3]|nr:hypothetical protein [Okeania sp. SIO2B3]
MTFYSTKIPDSETTKYLGIFPASKSNAEIFSFSGAYKKCLSSLVKVSH